MDTLWIQYAHNIDNMLSTSTAQCQGRIQLIQEQTNPNVTEPVSNFFNQVHILKTIEYM